MTLVEILIAMAIASLMTLTGWRAIDALQTSRDRVQQDASRWQRLDDFFATLEADLRRASLTDFEGSADGMSLLQPSPDGGIAHHVVRYRTQPLAAATTPETAAFSVLRAVDGERPLPLADVRSVSFAYSVDGTNFEPATRAYPRALRVIIVVPGASGAVERLLALR